MPRMVNGIQLDIKALNNASPVIKQVANDIGGLETSAQNAGDGVAGANTEMAGMEGTLQSLKMGLTGATLAVGAFVAAFEFGEIAAGNERLITSGQQLAASYGESLDQIVAKVKEASLGTVSDMDIITSANKAMMLGVGGSAEQLANLMEIAALRGRAMGISTTQAFDDMVRGIGRMSPMILDNLGIVVDADSTYGAYAESIGKTSSELSRAEKIQALLNKVLSEGNKMLVESGGLAEDNASKYERFNAELENTKNSLLENTLEMSRFADMGADVLSNFTEITGDQNILEFWAANASGVNAWNVLMGFAEERIEKMNMTLSSSTTSYAAWAQSVEEAAMSTQGLKGVTLELAAVDEDAVKGAMQVHETYQKLNIDMALLKSSEFELLEEKQKLIDEGWWPESEKIQNVNDKLDDNWVKQQNVTLAMQGTLDQMLINTAMAGLDADAQLALARSLGLIDEESYAVLTAQGLLKKQYEDGTITAQQYADKTVALKDAVARLESKGIVITVEGLYTEVRNIVTNYSQSGTRAQSGSGARFAEGTEGWVTVPPGYPNDSYPVMMQSGERFAVIPAGVNAMPAGGGGGMGGRNLTFVYAPGVSFGDEQEAREKMAPLLLEVIQQYQANGQI